MEKEQNYRLMVEIRDMTKVKGQFNPFNDPVPETQIVVELDGDDLEHIMYRRLFEFWDRKDAEFSALAISNLWDDRFRRKKKLSKNALKQYMFDIGSVVKNEANINKVEIPQG